MLDFDIPDDILDQVDMLEPAQPEPRPTRADTIQRQASRQQQKSVPTTVNSSVAVDDMDAYFSELDDVAFIDLTKEDSIDSEPCFVIILMLIQQMMSVSNLLSRPYLQNQSSLLWSSSLIFHER